MGLRILPQQPPGPCCSCGGEFVLLTTPTGAWLCSVSPSGFSWSHISNKGATSTSKVSGTGSGGLGPAIISEDGGFKQQLFVSNRCF